MRNRQPSPRTAGIPSVSCGTLPGPARDLRCAQAGAGLAEEIVLEDAVKADHVDIVIIGAGLSGIGAACHLREKCPGRDFAILEARDCIGGTWDLFRYPGVRSDSDMFTLGYAFKPWTGAKSITDGQSILDYVREAAREHGVDRKIRFNHRVKRASWSSPEMRWTVEVERGPAKEVAYITCNFLLVCSGYYSYAEGYTPPFPGVAQFKGAIVHPQNWTEDVVYANKRVVVIGSGATAVTLVPELAKSATHVTLLQRSPTYVVAWPDEDRVANVLRRWLPAKAACSLARWKNVLGGMYFYRICKRNPERAKTMIRDGLRAELGRTSTSARISPRATIPGSNGCAWRRTAISSSRSEAARPRS